MSKQEKLHSAEHEQRAYNLLLAEESLILDAQIAIQSILNERKMSQAELARKLGVGESYISQMLGASARNLTLRTVARVMSALGETPHLTIRRRLDEFRQRVRPYQCDAEFGPWGEVVMLDASEAQPSFGVFARDWAANENVAMEDWAAAA